MSSPSFQLLSRPDPSGFVRNAVLIDFHDGRRILHSPTWLGDETKSLLGRAPISAYFAPNHYHYLGIGKHQAVWPAPVLAPEKAIRRLGRQGVVAEGVQAHASNYPEVQFLQCPHLKNGEGWIVAPGPNGNRLIVCDAFFNMAGPFHGTMGFMIRLLKVGPGLRVGRTFEFLIEDRRKYVDYARSTLKELAPSEVYFSHGPAITGGDTTDRMLDALGRVKL